MDWYLIFKFLHIASTILWLGSGWGILVLAFKAEREKDDAELLKVLTHGSYLAGRVLVPASLSAVVTGVVLVFLGQSWSDIWVLIGLAGFASTFTFGNFFIKPLTDRMLATAAKSGPAPDVLKICRRILLFIKFDVVVIFTVVADMVLKPVAADWETLAVMAVVVLSAGIWFIRPSRLASA